MRLKLMDMVTETVSDAINNIADKRISFVETDKGWVIIGQNEEYPVSVIIEKGNNKPLTGKQADELLDKILNKGDNVGNIVYLEDENLLTDNQVDQLLYEDKPNV